MGNGFRELRVWQEAKKIAVDVYKLVRKSPLLDKDWGLRDQIQRVAVSIPLNIFQGAARKSDKGFCCFSHIASGSLAELITQLEIALELEMIKSCDSSDLMKQLEYLSASLGALIKSRRV